MSVAVSVQQFSRHFESSSGPIQAVEEASFTIAPGEFVALVGPSGCGKSTMLRAIAGLDTEYTGEIRADDRLIQGPDLSRGIIFQEPRLFPWLTLAQNVGFGLRLAPSQRTERVSQLIELVGLTGFERHYPHQLSGGMAQRVAIARALAPNPKVLLLDEPFSALDAFTRIRLQDELQKIWSTHRITTMLVTHDIDEAIALSQRVLVMTARPGQIANTFTIDLPYPRNRGSEQFAAYRRDLLAALHLKQVEVSHAS